jgi:non-heme chloroperoxidase
MESGMCDRLMRGAVLLVLASLTAGCEQGFRPWRDPSKHRVEFVTVKDNVRLEVLDWGGSGRPVMLLAGLGNTAHVFDDFAGKLSGAFHVYGITRRGFGVSSRPGSGYTAQRLADDVAHVLDSLKLVAPVLVGHSIAGEELTLLGAQHSDRIAGLVYLDAVADLTLDFSAYDALRRKLPAALRDRPSPSGSDLKSFQAYRDWQVRTLGFAFPEAELRNDFDAGPNGTVGRYRTDGSVFRAIRAGVQKRDYSKIPVPVLAFFAVPRSGVDPRHPYQPKDAQERNAIEEVHAADLSYINRYKESLQSGVPGARVIELLGADHYVFLSNEADVLRELRAFVAGLH